MSMKDDDEASFCTCHLCVGVRKLEGVLHLLVDPRADVV